MLWANVASYESCYLGQETGHSGYAWRGENFEDTLRVLPQSPSFHAESKEQAKHLVEERLHWVPDAISGNFMGE